MAPIDFEKRIKEKFHNREIEPSADAWEDIAQQLGSGNGRRTRFRYRAVVAAAVLLGLVLSVTLLWRDNAESAESPSVNQISSEPDPEERDIPAPVRPEDEVVSAVDEEPLAPEILPKEAITEVAPQSSPDITGDAQVAEAEQNTEEIGAEAELINNKIEELVAQVSSLEASRGEVTDAEVDSLLRQAQEELLIETLYAEDMPLEAAALLAEVETEIDRSLRDKLFEKLRQGFEKVRTAVADRNK